MKKVSLFIALLLIALLTFPSCRKMDKKAEESASAERMDELTVTPAFSWGTARAVEFSLTSAKNGAVYIRNSKGDCFHKGMLSTGEPYTISVMIPSAVSEVKLTQNGTSAVVPITGDKVTYRFN